MPQNKVTWCNLICVTASLSQVDTWHWPSPRYTLRHTHTGELATNTEPISTIRSYVAGSDVNVTYTGTLVKLGPASIDTLFQSYRFGMEVKVTYKILVSRKKLWLLIFLRDQSALVNQNWVTRSLWLPKTEWPEHSDHRKRWVTRALWLLRINSFMQSCLRL